MGRYIIQKGKSQYECDSVSTVASVISDNTKALQRWAVNLAKQHLKGLIEKAGQVTDADVDFACKLHEQHLETAGDFGTDVHDIINDYIHYTWGKLKKEPEIKDEIVLKMMVGIQEWADENVDFWIASEMVVCDLKQDPPLAGRFDALVKLKNGEIALIDFKTSKQVYANALVQIGGYAELISKTLGQYTVKMVRDKEDEDGEARDEEYKKTKLPIPTCAYIFHLSKVDGKLALYHFNRSQLFQARHSFNTCLLLYRMRKNTDKIVRSGNEGKIDKTRKSPIEESAKKMTEKAKKARGHLA